MPLYQHYTTTLQPHGRQKFEMHKGPLFGQSLERFASFVQVEGKHLTYETTCHGKNLLGLLFGTYYQTYCRAYFANPHNTC